MTPVFPHSESRSGRDDDLLSLYLAGKLDPANAQRVESWMRSHPASRDVVEQFVSGAVVAELQPPDATRVLRALESRMDADERSGEVTPPSGRSRASAQRYGWIALGVAGLLFAVMFDGWVRRTRDNSDAALASMSTYTTPNGQLSSLTLPDGSTVVLNVSSRLEVPTSYNVNDRTVRLQGEAFFNVVADSKRPFVVVTPRSSTRVLGTSFVVREYRTDTVTVVAVKTGEVAVQKVVVSGQQQVTINQDGMARLAPAPRDFTTFTSGILSLDRVPLSEAVVDLGRWYNVEIRLNDAALKTQEITGKFAMGSPNDLVAILQMTFDIRVVREGRVLTLYSK